MEKNVSVDVYMTLDSNSLKKVKKFGEEEALASDFKEGELCFADTKWETEEIYFDKSDKSLYVTGEIFVNGEKIGYLSPKIPLGNDTVIEIIEFHMKKLGKLKTVMEALKD